MKNCLIVGIGQIGFRHLQGLVKVKEPLIINLMDSSIDSILKAKNRFDELSICSDHKIIFLNSLSEIDKNTFSSYNNYCKCSIKSCKKCNG